jgi:tetratricopeptide (TPR) repeat protein
VNPRVAALSLVLLTAGGTTGRAQAPLCHVPTQTEAGSARAQLRVGYGRVHLAITTRSPEAQSYFDQGLGLLHAFWFYEADRSFAEAARLDPDCAMAQWGIAMSNLNDARRSAAVKRARALSHLATPHEQLYIKAVEAKYRGRWSSVQNNPSLGSTDAYRDALRRLVAAYPVDVEARLFLALALMSGYDAQGAPMPGTEEAISLIRSVLATNPRHPAAHHYLIHALEASRRPQDAVASADVYASLVPAVGHAVHMPGHIYVHVDRWDDAAAAFEASAAVDRAYMRDQHESSDHTAGPYAHNLHFLATVYGYQGRYRDGLRVAREMLAVAGQPGEGASRAALEGRLATLRLLVRFERWDEIRDGHLPDAGGFTVVEGWRHFALGLARMGHDDLTGARVELSALKKHIGRAREALSAWPPPPQLALQQRQALALEVAPLELEGRIVAREGQADAAIALLKRALDAETRIGYSEPPLYLHPMQEVLGQVLLDLKRWSDAEAMFGAALQRDPGSGRALFGLMEAREGAGRHAQALDAYREFRQAWAHADPDLPQMRPMQ